MKSTITTARLCVMVLTGAVLAIASLLQAGEQPGGRDSAETDDIRAYMRMLRSDVNLTKIATINRVMKLTALEADKFWPIYRSYEKELAAVGDRKLSLIARFATLHASGMLEGRQAAELAEGFLQNAQDRLDLWKKYHKEISTVVSPVRAAQFLQIENQMALFIDVTIASEMPTVGSKPTGGM